MSVFTSVQVWIQFNWSFFRFYAYILTQTQSNFHKWLHLPCVLYCWWQCRSGRRRRGELKGLASEWVHLIIIPTRGCPSVALRSSIHPISDARGRCTGSDGTWQGAPRSAEPAIILILVFPFASVCAQLIWEIFEGLQNDLQTIKLRQHEGRLAFEWTGGEYTYICLYMYMYIFKEEGPASC